MKYYPTVTDFDIVICQECLGSGIHENKTCQNCCGKGYFGIKTQSKKIVDFGFGTNLPAYSFFLFKRKFGIVLKIILLTLFSAGLFSGIFLVFRIFSSLTLFDGKNLISLSYNPTTFEFFLETLFWIGFMSLGIYFYIFPELSRPRAVIDKDIKILSEKELELKKNLVKASSDLEFRKEEYKTENLKDGITPEVRGIFHDAGARWGYLSPLTTFEVLLSASKGKVIIDKIGANRKEVEKAIQKEIEKERTLVEEKFGNLKDLLKEKIGPRILSESHLMMNLALESAVLSNQKHVGVSATSLGIVRTPSGQKVLDILNVNFEDFVNIIHWVNVSFFLKRWRFWRNKTITWTGGIALDWGYGYTPMVDAYCFDTSKVKKRKGLDVHVIGRNNEIEELERLLARESRRANVLLIGEAGVGKGALIRGLSSKILTGNTIKKLKGKRIVSVDVSSLLSGVNIPGEFERRMNRILFEARRAENVILFIGEVHEVLDAGTGTGVDVGEILRKGAEYGVQMIISTNEAGFKKHIEPRGSLLEYFQIMRLKELTTTQTILVLEDYAHMFENHYNVKITYQAIKQAVLLSERYFHDRVLPAKAIDLLEDSVIRTVEVLKEKIVTDTVVSDIVSQRTGIPVSKMSESEKEKLALLEKEFEKHIIGQKEAVKAVCDVLRRSRSGISSAKKPIGSFLFVGPTGVGKTEVARVLAKIYYGSEKNIVRLDMSEYQDRSSINRLIGAPPGFYESEIGGQLTEAVRKNPFTLVLLDELEKAHPDILNVFLQVLEDGRLTDSSGKVADFTNSIIIATSNAGANLIVEETKKGTNAEEVKTKLLNFVIESRIYSPEFINRFDSVIYFTPLSRLEAIEVSKLLLASIQKKMSEKRILISFAEEVPEYLVDIGYTPEFGARSLRRIIQEKIESIVAKKIVEGEIKEGEEAVITKEMIQ